MEVFKTPPPLFQLYDLPELLVWGGGARKLQTDRRVIIAQLSLAAVGAFL
jgi:hypothetical protein